MRNRIALVLSAAVFALAALVLVVPGEQRISASSMRPCAGCSAKPWEDPITGMTKGFQQNFLAPHYHFVSASLTCSPGTCIVVDDLCDPNDNCRFSGRVTFGADPGFGGPFFCPDVSPCQWSVFVGGQGARRNCHAVGDDDFVHVHSGSFQFSIGRPGEVVVRGAHADPAVPVEVG